MSKFKEAIEWIRKIDETLGCPSCDVSESMEHKDGCELVEFMGSEDTAEADAWEQGVKAWAWWKDGEQQVGTCGTTLAVALEKNPYRTDETQDNYDGVTVTCNRGGCGWVGPIDQCPPALSVYHDLVCPECSTTSLTTSKAVGGYGTNNFLQI